MENMDASLWYYDRSGAVSTTAFRLRENLSLFARFIIALSALKGVDVGFQPDFIRPVDKSCVPPKNLCGWKIELEGGEVTLKTILDSRYGIVGRGTLVYSGSMKFSDGKVEDDVVVKLAWQVVSRTAEWEFTRHLKGSSVYPKEFVVRLHGIHRGVSLLVRFRKRLKLPAHSYEDRQLQIMVSERFKLIAELEDPVDVKHGLWCVFEGQCYLCSFERLRVEGAHDPSRLLACESGHLSPRYQCWQPWLGGTRRWDLRWPPFRFRSCTLH